MADKKSYSEKLKDPRWQRVRLQVFERDGWTCRKCRSKEKMLAVHHLDYCAGVEPWDYPLDYLATLCQDCHQKEYEERRKREDDLIFACKMAPLWVDDLSKLFDFVTGLAVLVPDVDCRAFILDLMRWALGKDGLQALSQVVEAYNARPDESKRDEKAS